MMTTPPHPDRETLLRIAEGEREGLTEALDHLRDCGECRGEVAQLRGFIEAVAEELLHGRPGCPSSDELAALPPGSQDEHPHVRDCPLCREELEMILALESRGLLGGTDFDGEWVRPELLQTGGPVLYAASGDEIAIDVAEGQLAEGSLAGAKLALSATAEEILVEVEGRPEKPLVLHLESELLEKNLPLDEGETRVPRASWQRAEVRTLP